MTNVCSSIFENMNLIHWAFSDVNVVVDNNLRNLSFAISINVYQSLLTLSKSFTDEFQYDENY